MNNIVETPSGLLLPSSALPQSSLVNPFDIIFRSKEACQSFIDRCIIRWQYFLGTYNSAKVDEPERWKCYARRGDGKIHDTQLSSFQQESGDTRLSRFVEIKQRKEGDYVIVHKHEQ